MIIQVCQTRIKYLFKKMLHKSVAHSYELTKRLHTSIPYSYDSYGCDVPLCLFIKMVITNIIHKH